MMHRLVALDDRLSLLAARLARAWCRLTGTSSRALEYAVAVAIWLTALLAVVVDHGDDPFGRGVNAAFIAISSLYVFWPTTQRDSPRARNPMSFSLRLIFLALLVGNVIAAAGALLGGEVHWAAEWALMASNCGAVALLYYLLREPPADPEPRARTVAAPSEGQS